MIQEKRFLLRWRVKATDDAIHREETRSMAPPGEKKAGPPPIAAAIRSCFEAVPEVAAVFLFGSHASGTQHPGSDVDIAVLTTGDESVFAGRMQEFYLRLSRILKTDLHLVTLNSAPAELVRQVLSKGRCVLNLRPMIGRVTSSSRKAIASFIVVASASNSTTSATDAGNGDDGEESEETRMPS